MKVWDADAALERIIDMGKTPAMFARTEEAFFCVLALLLEIIGLENEEVNHWLAREGFYGIESHKELTHARGESLSWSAAALARCFLSKAPP